MSHPQQWAERTVVVRGTVLDVRQLLPRGPAETAPLRVIITPPMPPQNPQATAVGDRMLYAQSVARGTALMLLTQPPNVVVALLRRVLLLGDLLPPPQRGSTFGSGLYRIRLAPAGRSCVRLRPLLRRLLHAPKRRLRVLQSRPLRDCYDGIFADYLP